MKRLIALGTVLALAACSGDAPESDEAVLPVIAEAYAQPLSAFEGDAKLTPLAADAAQAAELGQATCAFSYQNRPLVLTGPDKGVAVLDGREVDLTGGGTQWTAGDTTFSVELGADEAADLVIDGDGAETRFSPGTWSCAT